MEEFVILHQILNQKNIVFSVQVVSGNANLTFALNPISLLIIYLLFTVRQDKLSWMIQGDPKNK